MDEGEPVQLRLGEEATDGVDVREVAFGRLQALGHAYGLHILSDVVEPYELVVLDPLQSESLLDELAFLVSIVDDNVVRAAAALIQPVAEASARRRIPLVVDWDF